MATREAVARADALLLEHLSPEQRDDYRSTRSFLVVTPAGRRYRLHGDRVNYQAHLLAPDSEFVLAQYCVEPKEGGIPKSDSLLAQMLLLQSDEARFLLTANERLFVLEIHRYLNGELKPPPPSTPQHEPDLRRMPPGSVWRDTAIQQIRTTYRCADHTNQSTVLRESTDGRGIDLHYPCGCPPRYVSFRRFDERRRSLQARATGPITTAFNPPRHRNRIGGAIADHQEECGCSGPTQMYALDGRAINLSFACGAREVHPRRLMEE